MGSQQHSGAPSIAAQVAEMAKTAREESARLSVERAEYAKRMATPAWMNRERVVRGALIVAAPILAILIAASIEEWSLSDLVTPNPSPAVALHQAQGAMDTVVKEFDAYVTDYSELPENLVEIGVPAPGDWTYTKRPDNQYQLVLKMYGQVITFESSRRSGS